MLHSYFSELQDFMSNELPQMLSGDADEFLNRYADGERNFVGINLCGVVLEGRDLRGANLSEANLSGADLRGVTMSTRCKPILAF